VKTTPEYTNKSNVDKQNEMLTNSFAALSTYVMMQGADSSKYGSLMKGLVSQFSMKNDQYPRTMTNAVDVMAKHQFDQAFYDRKKAAQNRNSTDNKERESKPQLAQMKVGYCCHICGKDDHPKKECPKSDLPRKDWFVTKAMNRMQHTQQDEGANADNDGESDNRSNEQDNKSDNKSSGWCAFETISDNNDEGNDESNVTFKQTRNVMNKEMMQNKFLLDTGSTIRATIMNEKLISNIRPSNKPMIMSTNTRSKVLKMDGDVKGFGIAKYDPSHMANIMGFSHMADKYHVTYDNSKDDAFHVHTDNGIICFGRDGRLYLPKSTWRRSRQPNLN